MKKVFVLILLLTGLCLAQNEKADYEVVTLDSESTIVLDNQPTLKKPAHKNGQSQNDVTITQSGHLNEAMIQQAVIDNSSKTTLDQNGDFNSADLRVIGENNILNVQQSGNSNKVNSILAGRNLQSDIDQRGNSNEINQLLLGQNQEFSIQQYGQNNQLTQINLIETPKPILIQQKGSGMKLIITNK